MSLAEFLDLPRQEQRCELLDGVVIVAAFPIPDHQILATALAAFLWQQIVEPGLGIVMHEAGLALWSQSALGPDLTVIRTERASIIGTKTVDGAPDIVVEVLSSDRRADRVRKRELYEAAGIPEYWILDGDADTVTALASGDDGRYQEREVFTVADTLTTPLFPVFSLPLEQLFNHPARLRARQG
jgi:Uma2 family endonuclease